MCVLRPNCRFPNLARVFPEVMAAAQVRRPLSGCWRCIYSLLDGDVSFWHTHTHTHARGCSLNMFSCFFHLCATKRFIFNKIYPLLNIFRDRDDNIFGYVYIIILIVVCYCKSHTWLVNDLFYYFSAYVENEILHEVRFACRPKRNLSLLFLGLFCFLSFFLFFFLNVQL